LPLPAKYRDPCDSRWDPSDGSATPAARFKLSVSGAVMTKGHRDEQAQARVDRHTRRRISGSHDRNRTSDDRTTRRCRVARADHQLRQQPQQPADGPVRSGQGAQPGADPGSRALLHRHRPRVLPGQPVRRAREPVRLHRDLPDGICERRVLRRRDGRRAAPRRDQRPGGDRRTGSSRPASRPGP
jgi:hypothetical protein